MRLIPGKTKIKLEIFKGVTFIDIIVGLVFALLIIFVFLSTLPFKLPIAGVLLFIGVLLLVHVDGEPNYVFVRNMFHHLAYPKTFNNLDTDEFLKKKAKDGTTAAYFDEIIPEAVPVEETGQEAPAPEEEADKEKNGMPEEETAPEKKGLFLKKEKKNKAKKESEASGKTKKSGKHEKKETENSPARRNTSAEDVSRVMGFTGIEDRYICFGKYFGVVLEIPAVDFRFFSSHRRTNAIENGLGAAIRTADPEYGFNLIKLDKTVSYLSYIDNEYGKLDELRHSYENGSLTEEELKMRVEVLYDRINSLETMQTDEKTVVPAYYLVFFGANRHRLDIQVNEAMNCLAGGEMKPKRLKGGEQAIFLRYTNQLDFDETDLKDVLPEDYYSWALPKSVRIRNQYAEVNGVIEHNMRVVNYPAGVNDAWLARVLSLPSSKVVVKGKEMDRAKTIRAIDLSLAELRGKLHSASTQSAAIEAQQHIETLSDLLVMLQNENETLFMTNIYVTCYDLEWTEKDTKLKTPEKTSLVRINGIKKYAKRVYREAGLRLNSMSFNQFNAFVGSQVSAYDPLRKDGRGIPSNTLGATFPWIYAYTMDKNGINLGSEEGVPVFLNFFRRDSERVNSNMVIIGKSGSGKSYATKSILTNLAADDAKIFILDPENEYQVLAKNLKGKYINVGNASHGRINPFQIIVVPEEDDEGKGENTSAYTAHLQFLEEFFKQILPDCDRDSLEYLNTLVDRVYQKKNITPESDFMKLRPEEYPIFDDLYDEVLREFQRTDNDYIRTILRTLMNYVSKFAEGGRNAALWNGPSSLETDENFIVFGFQSLLANRNSTVSNAQMLLVLKYIDNEIIKNRDYNIKYGEKRKIVVVIDEAHVFIDEKFPVALDFMFQLAKRIRKYNGMQIVITQNIKDFVGTEEIARKSTAIINACQYSFIFSLAPNDISDLCKLYEKAGGINENEQEQIVQAKRGHAFTILSPSERSSFRVDVPEGTKAVFKDRNFVSSYFNGEDGEENWLDYLGNAREKRAEILGTGKETETQEEQQLRTGKVTFVKKTREDLEREKREQETEKRIQETEDRLTEERERLNLEREEADKLRALREEILGTDAGTDGGSAPEIPINVTAGKTVYGSAPIPSGVAPTYGMPSQGDMVYTNSILENLSRMQENLTGLVGSLGKEAMESEIRRQLREELGKEAPGVRSGGPKPEGLFSTYPDTEGNPEKESGEEPDSFNMMSYISEYFAEPVDSDAEETAEPEGESEFHFVTGESTEADLGGTRTAGNTEAGENESGVRFSFLDYAEKKTEQSMETEDEEPVVLYTGDEPVVTINFETLMKYNRQRSREAE